MRVVLCENGLRDLQGHHFDIASEMKEELAGREIPLTILAHRSVEQSIRAALGAIPTFDATPYDSLSPSFRRRQLWSFVRSAWRFAPSLEHVEIGTDDLILVLHTRAAEILGLSIWSRRTNARPAAVVLNFMADDFLRARTRVPRWTTKLLTGSALCWRMSSLEVPASA